MHVKLELLKAEREAVVNQRIEEIRKKNAIIAQRHEEIENDKRNAEHFSQEATERMKVRPPSVPFANEENKNETERRPSKTIENAKFKQVSIKSKKEAIDVLSTESNFRPQRLSEKDLPPPDPVFSFLTDRLREGAFCSPIDLSNRRKQSTSSQASEMSIDSSRSGSSRRVSTCSNSSWTSDSSSKHCGFSNYQPPRKYSACRDYLRSRRISSAQNFSYDNQGEKSWKTNSNECESSNISEGISTSSRKTRQPASRNGLRKLSDSTNSAGFTKSIQLEEGTTRSSQKTITGLQYVTNWRLHAVHSSAGTTGQDVDAITSLANLHLSDIDPNNNEGAVDPTSN